MRIDEFEFQDKNGNEIEPTKNQLVIYIKSLHKQIKDLKDTQSRVAIKVLTKAKFDIQNIFNQVDKYDGEYCELYWKLSKFFNQFNDYFDKQIENLKGE